MSKSQKSNGHGSITAFVRARVLEDNAIDDATLQQKLAEAGYGSIKKRTMQTTRSDCLQTIRIARELGLMEATTHTG